MTTITRRRLGLAASAIIATMVVAAVPAATLAADPLQTSAETGAYVEVLPGVDHARLTSPSTAIDGWTVSAGQIDWTGPGIWKAAHLDRSIDLNGGNSSFGAVSQTFDTKIGSTYVVTFAMSGNPSGDRAVKTMTVVADGGLTTPFTYNVSLHDTTLGNMQWQPQAYSFIASSLSTTLTFASTTASEYGPAIDNVVVTETLKTGADCKKGGWESMTDRFGTAFRNQGDCVSYHATGERNLANPRD